MILNGSSTKTIVPTRLKLSRKKARLTQEKLGELIGRDAQTIRAWERGSYPVPDPIDKLISDKLSVPYEYLIGEDVPDNLADYETMLVESGLNGFNHESNRTDIQKAFFAEFLKCDLSYASTAGGKESWVSLIFEEDEGGVEHKLPQSILETMIKRIAREVRFTCYEFEHSSINSKLEE